MAKPTKHYGRWRIRWVDEHGRRQSAVFDDYKTAAFELRKNELEVDERRRGLRAPEPPRRTVGEAIGYWKEHRSPLKRSADDDESIFRSIEPFFARTGLDDVAGIIMAVDRYRASKLHLSPKTVANHLTLLGAVLRLAGDLGWMPKVPKIHKPKVRLISQDFCFLRTVEEIRRFLDAAKAEDDEQTFVLYATAVYTGGREGELAALQWADVDFENRLITVQRSFDGPTKAEDVRYVPVLDALLPILRNWRLRAPGKQVFTNREGRMLLPSSRVFQESLHRVLRRGAFENVIRNGKSRPYIRFHDLRHTFASHWVMNGGDLFKLQKILGHKTVQMTMRYAHLQPAAFRDDYGRMGAALVEGEILALSKTRRRLSMRPVAMARTRTSCSAPSLVGLKYYAALSISVADVDRAKKLKAIMGGVRGGMEMLIETGGFGRTGRTCRRGGGTTRHVWEDDVQGYSARLIAVRLMDGDTGISEWVPADARKLPESAIVLRR
jgi:integrase